MGMIKAYMVGSSYLFDSQHDCVKIPPEVNSLVTDVYGTRVNPYEYWVRLGRVDKSGPS